VVENYGDLPFLPGRAGPETVAALTAALRECARAVDMPLGVNCLRNDPIAALAACVAGGGTFLRTNLHTGVLQTDQGLMQGVAHELLRERARLNAAGVAIFADVLVKHGAPLGERDPRRHALDAVDRGLADAVLVTGAATGHRADFREVATVRDAVPATPLLVASGVVARDMLLISTLADGVLVGSTLEQGGKAGSPVEIARVRALVRAARKAFGR
jgi:membrane complex biogenesis BtpA family protein